jgi:hypothetical protein
MERTHPALRDCYEVHGEQNAQFTWPVNPLGAKLVFSSRIWHMADHLVIGAQKFMCKSADISSSGKAPAAIAPRRRKDWRTPNLDRVTPNPDCVNAELPTNQAGWAKNTIWLRRFQSAHSNTFQNACHFHLFA